MIKALQDDDFDLLILTGNYGYNLHDNYGKKGDEYFQKWEKIITSAPLLLLGGRLENVDVGRFLIFRFLFLSNTIKEENNIFTMNYHNMDFLFINLDRF